MSKTLGVYEVQRDAHHYPTCWQMIGNVCMPHFHSSWELVYVTSGELEAAADGRIFRLQAGDLLAVPGYAVHRYNSSPETDTYVMVIPIDYIPMFQQKIEGRRCQVLHLTAGTSSAEIGRSLGILSQEGDEGKDSFLMRGHCYVILGLLLEHIQMDSKDYNSDQNVTRDILDYLHGHYLQPLSLQEIATSLGYSRSSISHTFNKNVGCSIPEYLGRLRSRAAATMLLEQNTAVTDVAISSGFESVRSFYRIFKQCFGVTPSQFIQLSLDDPEGMIKSNHLHVC